MSPLENAFGIRLESDLGCYPVFVRADLYRLQQIFWNLLSNALKFTPAGGLVQVRLDCTVSQAQIQVSDTGCGIDADFLPYVFERYSQGENAGNTDGLGLGLAIGRHLVELHGGTVQADSPGKAQGTTFTVRLPLLQPEEFK